MARYLNLRLTFELLSRRFRNFGGEKCRHELVGGLKIVLTFIGVLTLAIGGVGIMVAISYGLVWLVSPRPFLAELLDDAQRVTDIHLALSMQLVVITTSMLTIVGLISGFLPALKASRLDPIEALRYE